VQEASDKATAYNLVWSLPSGPDSWPESPAAADDSPAWLQVRKQLQESVTRAVGLQSCRLDVNSMRCCDTLPASTARHERAVAAQCATGLGYSRAVVHHLLPSANGLRA